MPTDRSWTFQWSTDGVTWTTVVDGVLEGANPQSNIGVIQRVGVFAGNQPDFFSAFNARFDYYRTFLTAALPSPAPEHLVASAGDQQVTLSWEEVNGSEEYTLNAN